MTQADFKTFSALIQGIAECYGQSLSAQGIALRFRLLEQFDFAEVEKAALSVMATRKYTSMPTPADFLEHIGGGSAEDKAEVEAGKVLDAIGRHGAYSSVVFDDSVTQAVIVQAYGGWPKLLNFKSVQETAQEKIELQKKALADRAILSAKNEKLQEEVHGLRGTVTALHKKIGHLETEHEEDRKRSGASIMQLSNANHNLHARLEETEKFFRWNPEANQMHLDYIQEQRQEDQRKAAEQKRLAQEREQRERQQQAEKERQAKELEHQKALEVERQKLERERERQQQRERRPRGMGMGR